jgi:tetratricopeptide (TPR) repeat protein
MRKRTKIWGCIFLAVTFFLASDLLVRAKTHLELANEYAAQSEEFFEKAVSEYNLALKEAKADKFQINFLLGRLYYGHGKFKEAIQTLLPLYEGEREDFALAKFLAFSYYKNGDYTDALVIFEKNRDSENEEFLYVYGRTCERQNLFNQAIEVYERIRGIEYGKLARERVAYISAQTRVLPVEDIADPYIRDLIKSAPGQAEYPNAGAIILLDERTVRILSDYTAIEELHFLVKILNDRGKEKYGEVKLWYDSTYEKIEIEYARTIKPDGTITPVGAKHIRDISEYPEYPLYSNARLRIISMPELTEGAVIEYKTKKYINKLINGKEFCENYPLQSLEPYLNQRISLIIPEGYNFNLKSYNPGYLEYELDFSPRVEKLDAGTKYSWEFRNVPETIREPSMPPYVEITPYLSISSLDDWQELYDWWKNLTIDKIKTDKAIEEKTQALIKDRNTQEEKARAIYHWVASKIRYVGVEYGEAGFEPHRATEIFRNKYGDCKDQVMLLISMLRYAGISAYPVLIGTKGSYLLDEEFSTLIFNHAICLAKVGEELVFLDPTAETTSFGDLPGGDQNRKVFVFYEREGKIEKTPLFEPEHNRACISMAIDIHEDETISGTRKINTFGEYDQGQRYWLKYTKPVLIEEYLKSTVNNLSPGGKLLSHTISDTEDLNKPIEIRMEFEGPKFLTEAAEDRLVPQLGGFSTSLVSRDERSYPIDFRTLDEFDVMVKIKLPENLIIKYLPPPVIKDTPWFTYLNKYSFSQGIIFFEESLVHKRVLVAPEDYEEYKRICEDLARQTDKQAVLERVSQTE